MIEVLGTDPSAELDAANALRDMITEFIPEIRDSGVVSASIIPNVQCYGENPRDIDLVLIFWDQRREEKLITTSSGAKIRSLCVTVEVKGHSAKSVFFRSGKCYVNYRGHEHDVSNQSEKQKYSLRSFLIKRFAHSKSSKASSPPWILNLIWMRNLPKSSIPSGGNIMGGNEGFQEFLDLLEKTEQKIVPDATPFMSFYTQWLFSETQRVLVEKIEPTRIDRKKLEGISRRILTSEQQYAVEIGEKLLLFRGRGGTGKTVRLLRIANQLYQEKQFRILILTYNRALAADLERILTLMQIRDLTAGQSIKIKTLHSFMSQWLYGFGLTNIDKTEERRFKYFESEKAQLLSMLVAGAIESKDIEDLKRERSRDFRWDVVMIDESQDWPDNERDILYRLYRPDQFVLADGVDQLVRSTKVINWRDGIDSSVKSQIVPLRKSLRLKSELCGFVSKFAEEIGYPNWDLKPVPEAHGGRVLIYTGDPFRSSVFASVLDASTKAGNENIDCLVCVPPSLAVIDPKRRGSPASVKMASLGLEVWDGTDLNERGEIATYTNQLRLVQYDSCRGLEGWAVILIGLDEFFDYKSQTAAIDDETKQDMFCSDEEAALELAKRWTMIPLTRAIDTLAIHIKSRDSYIGKALQKIHENYPNMIEWID